MNELDKAEKKVVELLREKNVLPPRINLICPVCRSVYTTRKGSKLRCSCGCITLEVSNA